jgi:hypothetical protein
MTQLRFATRVRTIFEFSRLDDLVRHQYRYANVLLKKDLEAGVHMLSPHNAIISGPCIDRAMCASSVLEA